MTVVMHDVGDGQLLKEFRVRNDQDAFAELVRRHGGMIQGAARSVVGDLSAAQDIAQAVFLTMIRKSDQLEASVSVAGWLHRVTICIARDALRKESRRSKRERDASAIGLEKDTPPAITEVGLAALHEELGCLSEDYRRAIVLHYMEGMSCADAAGLLGCTDGTFRVRLTRAREKLRKRLIKRGITLGSAALVAALGQSASAAELPAGFVAATCAAAKGGAASAKVAALTQSALKMLFWAKVKTVTAICAATVLVGGAGVGVAVTLPLLLQPGVGPVETVDGSAVTAGMVLIPGGTNAGTDPDTGKPYSLTLESFLMDRCEVTKALWDEGAAWGLDHGYVFEALSGQGKAPEHPVHSVSWYDCVLWCNARSEKDGFTPVYYTDKACTVVWRQKHGLGPFVKTAADGYRLPTLVEWQYAARSGEPSHRYPWHDAETIDHTRANYNSFGPFPWDTSPTQGYHPTYAVEPKPYTSPVGVFAPNAYGLYDMAGNVSEWCFDDAGVGWKKYTGSSWNQPPSPVGWSEEARPHGFGAKTDRGFRTVRTPRTVTDAGSGDE